ncbi:MAG: chromosomal replication initiator protein DnaA, partial [Deltaproteobacteria bacterium]|nr:chromosomal replication initiator protein DnaA [Deltaproteobacteria bacterium]
MTALWQSVLDRLREKVSATNYSRWLSDVYPIQSSDNELHLAVPNIFTRDWINDYYAEVIRDELLH